MPRETIENEGLGCPICGAPEQAGCGHAQEYSEEFLDLAEKKGMKSLLAGSHVEMSFKTWENERRPIASGIDRDGSLLDVGCANGFLLRSLQEWSDHKLVPYGVDIDDNLLEQAKEIFPEQSDHFFNLDRPEEAEKLPQSVDMVYWNVWDNTDFEQAQTRRILDRILDLTDQGGRIILGFYHPDRAENERKVEQLQSLGFKTSELPQATDTSNIIITLER